MPDTKILAEIVERYFPLNGIPQKPRKTGEHPLWDYGPTNHHGYRSADFEDRKQFNIACIGCSWVEGIGVARQDIFSEVLVSTLEQSTDLSVTAWNLGQSGSGFDYAARLIPSVVDILKPDFIVLVVSGAQRREYFTSEGRHAFWNVTAPRKLTEHGRRLTGVEDKMITGFTHHQNENYDAAQFLCSFRLVSSLLKAHQIPWGFSWIEHPFSNEPMQRLAALNALPQEHFLGSVFRRVDYSSVDQHPGAQSHHGFADLIANYLFRQAVIAAKHWRDTVHGPKTRTAQSEAVLKSEHKGGHVTEDDDMYPMW